MKLNGADTEIGTTKVYSKVEALKVVDKLKQSLAIAKNPYFFCTVRNGRHVGWDLAHGRAVLLKTLI